MRFSEFLPSRLSVLVLQGKMVVTILGIRQQDEGYWSVLYVTGHGTILI